MANSTYTYRATGTGTTASGNPTPVYTAYRNGTAVAAVTRWVTHAGGNAWGATCLATSANGSGATRQAAVTAALAGTPNPYATPLPHQAAGTLPAPCTTGTVH